MRMLCHVCGDDTIVTRRGCCSVCDARLMSERRVEQPARPRVDRGRPAVDVSLVERAYVEWYVRDGLSLRRCADRLLEQPGVYYSSRESAARMLERQWSLRGYALRDRVAAAVAAQWKGGRCVRANRGSADHLEYRRDRRRRIGEVRGVACSAVAARSGEACKRSALTGSAFCIAHDPARRVDVEERLAEARARSPRCQPKAASS